MENSIQTNLFDAFRQIEGILPNIARTGLFSPGAQRYTQALAGKSVVAYRPMATVAARRQETIDTISLALTPPEGYPVFRAGQHIDVAVEIYGVRHVRQYSLTNLPGSKALQITVKRQQGGLVSNFIYGTIKPGSQIEISAPRGEFVAPARDHSAYLFFSAGSGITPVYAMVRSLLKEGAWGDIHFFHAAKSADAIIFRDELKRLAAEHENFHPHFFFSADAEITPERLNAATALLRLQGTTHSPQSPVMICGPGEFVQGIDTDLRGLHYTQIATEYYTLPQTAAGEGVVAFLRSGTEARAETNLLEAAEANGIKAKHGCRRGICHECKAHKRSGTVKNILTGKETSGEENIQLCISQPVGRVEIEL